MKNRCFCLLKLLLLSVGTVFAAEGRKEIFQAVTLNGDEAGGKFFLSRDITAPPSTAAIQVNGTGTQEFDLDLNGFTVTACENCGAIQAQNLRRVTIRNGNVRSPGPTGGLAMHINGSGLIDGRAVVEDVNIFGNGVELERIASFAIRRVVVEDSRTQGIRVEASDTVNTSGVIEDSVVRDSTAKAIEFKTSGLPWTPLDFNGIRMVNNDVNSGYITIEDTSRLLLQSNAVAGSTVPTTAGRLNLIRVDGCQVIGNAVHNSANRGINLFEATHCLVKDNVVSGAGSTGIHLENSSFNHVRGNVSNSNASFGIWLRGASNDNRLGENSAVGNSGAGCTTSATPVCPTTGDFCDEGTGNVSYGDNLLPGPPPC